MFQFFSQLNNVLGAMHININCKLQIFIKLDGGRRMEDDADIWN